MSKMNTYLQEQADQMGMSVEDYLESLNDGGELIEQEDFDLPMDWEPDYNGSSAGEQLERDFDLRKLK